MKIWISAGHQENTGANGFISEGKEAIFLRDSIVSHIKEKQPEITLKIDDDKCTLQAVINDMRKYKPDVMLDIHFNASTPKATGTEIFISDERSRDFANELVTAVSSILNIKNRGVKMEGQSQHSRLGMLHPTDGIKVLLEVCFVTNQNDSSIYIDKRDELSSALSEIICNYKYLES